MHSGSHCCARSSCRWRHGCQGEKYDRVWPHSDGELLRPGGDAWAELKRTSKCSINGAVTPAQEAVRKLNLIAGFETEDKFQHTENTIDVFEAPINRSTHLPQREKKIPTLLLDKEYATAETTGAQAAATLWSPGYDYNKEGRPPPSKDLDHVTLRQAATENTDQLGSLTEAHDEIECLPQSSMPLVADKATKPHSATIHRGEDTWQSNTRGPVQTMTVKSYPCPQGRRKAH